MPTVVIDKNTFDKIKSLGLPEKKENNQYLLIHLYGDGVKAPSNWNVKVFTNSKNRLTMVTTDEAVLNNLLGSGSVTSKKSASLQEFFGTQTTHTTSNPDSPKIIIQVDDSGWGFPLGGVMIGATDGNKVLTDIIDVKYFQEGLYESKGYLTEAARITLELTGRLGAKPDNSCVEICPGYVNSASYAALQKMKYSVERKEITGLLQNELEKRFFDYIAALGCELYYDPKESKDIPRKFNDVINWINEDKTNRMKLAKTGWGYFKRAKSPQQTSL